MQAGQRGENIEDRDDGSVVSPTNRQTTRDNAIYMQRCAVGDAASRTRNTTRMACGRIVDVTRYGPDQRLQSVAGSIGRQRRNALKIHVKSADARTLTSV